MCMLVAFTLKDLGTFCNTKHNVHRFTLNLHRLKIMTVESVPEIISCWGAVVFEKLVKQCHENTFLHAKIIFVSWSLRRKLFSWHCFTHFSKTTAPQQVIFSTIIIFKLCKFNVNLWTLCLLSYKKYIDPLKVVFKALHCVISLENEQSLLFETTLVFSEPKPLPKEFYTRMYPQVYNCHIVCLAFWLVPKHLRQ